MALLLVACLMLLLGGRRVAGRVFLRAAEHQLGILPAQPFTIAFCGTDRSGKRTDLMMLTFIDPAHKRALALSIPRDSLWCPPYGGGRPALINSAWARGPENTLDAIKQVSGTHPNHWVALSFEEAAHAVDAMGGVTVHVPTRIHHVDHAAGEEWSLEPGDQHLSGKQVVRLARERHSLADGSDVRGRIPMQQTIARALIAQMRSAGPLQLFRAAHAVGQVKSDLPTLPDNSGRPALVQVVWALRKYSQGGSGGLTFATIPWEFTGARVRIDPRRAAAQRAAINSFLAAGTPLSVATTTSVSPATNAVQWIPQPPDSAGFVRLPHPATPGTDRKARYYARTRNLPLVADPTMAGPGIEVRLPARERMNVDD